MSISLGTWLNIGSEAIAEIASSYFDWVCIDLEHTTIGLDKAEQLIRVIDLNKSKPYVRLPFIDESTIKKVLDAGAQGIVAPNVTSAEDVDKLMSYIYYPSQGKRGVGLARAQGYGHPLKKAEYFESKSKDIDIYVQIESNEALKNIDSIFNKSISGYFIGPYDLSASLGVTGDFQCTEFVNAEKIILEAAQKYNIKRGFHVVEPLFNEVKTKISKGYNLIAFSTDFRVLDHYFMDFINKAQDEL